MVFPTKPPLSPSTRRQPNPPETAMSEDYRNFKVIVENDPRFPNHKVINDPGFPKNFRLLGPDKSGSGNVEYEITTRNTVCTGNMIVISKVPNGVCSFRLLSPSTRLTPSDQQVISSFQLQPVAWISWAGEANVVDLIGFYDSPRNWVEYNTRTDEPGDQK